MSKEQYFNVDWCRWQGDVSDFPASQRGEVSVLTITTLSTPSLTHCPLPHLWLHQRQWLRALQTPIKRLLPVSASMPCPAVLNLFLCLFMSCQSVLTLSLCLSWCDTKPCPTVRPCSHLERSRCRPIFISTHFGRLLSSFTLSHLFFTPIFFCTFAQ